MLMRWWCEGEEKSDWDGLRTQEFRSLGVFSYQIGIPRRRVEKLRILMLRSGFVFYHGSNGSTKPRLCQSMLADQKPRCLHWNWSRECSILWGFQSMRLNGLVP